jgi:hypothetical protein
MLKRILSTLSTGALLVVATPVMAHAQQKMPMGNEPKGVEKTIKGTVIDVSCKFRHGLTGKDHVMCAGVCADKGIPLAILGSDGKLYLPVSSGMPGEPSNAQLKPYAEQQVTVKGTVFAAGGANAVQIASIQ